jgi:glycosyltransferase involved in cell wall biosynthesis
MMGIFLLNFIGLFLVAVNSLTIRRVKDESGYPISNSVDVLIPMRNEEENAAPCIEAVLESDEIDNFRVYVLDDGSTDETAKILKNHPVNILAGSYLKEGWLGKNFACHQLVQASTSEYMVFLDADVRISKYAIASAIRKIKELEWDFISPYPKQLAGSLSERLVQPLLQWSWLASVPLRLAEIFPNRSMTIANGQFFVVRRSAYLSTGGHSEIRDEVLDDLELARLLVANGFKGGVAEGSSVAKCRMYQSAAQLQEGYTKSIWKAFGGKIGTLFTILLLAATGIVPLFTSFISLGLIIFSRIIAALRTKSNPLYAFLHPLSVAYLIYLIALSWKRKSENKLLWRGRSV